MVRLSSRLAALALLATAMATPFDLRAAGLGIRAPPNPPSKDPFYDVPDNIASLAPGTVIRHRPPPAVIGAFDWHPENLLESRQILYRTTDGLDQATATVMTALIPKNANHSRVVSFQPAVDAASIDCAPSYGFLLPTQDDPLLGSPTVQVQLLLIEGALARGWVVIVEDVAGPEGAYGVPLLSARSVLDGIRAAHQSGNVTGIPTQSDVVMWGYSGGSGVTKGAADLQPLYAPELRILGAAIGGVGASDAAPSIALVNKSESAGLIPAALLGIANQYEEYARLIHKHLLPEYRELFYSTLDRCLEAIIKAFSGRDVLGMFDDWDALLTGPIPEKIFNNSQIDTVATAPIFWYQNVQDAIIPIDAVDKEVKKYCERGANVRYQRNDAAGVTHQNYGLIGTTDVMKWFDTLFAHQVPEPGCTTKTVHQSEVDPDFVALFPPYIQQSLLNFGNTS